MSCKKKYSLRLDKTIFIRQIPLELGENKIKELFKAVKRSLSSQFGEVEKFQIVKDKKTGEPKGYALLQFKEKVNFLLSQESAARALKEGIKYNNKSFLITKSVYTVNVKEEKKENILKTIK